MGVICLWGVPGAHDLDVQYPFMVSTWSVALICGVH